MSTRAGSKLEHARLLIMQPPGTVGGAPGGRIARVKFKFNPNQLTLTKRTEWRRKPSRTATQAAVPEFVGSAPRTLSVEVFLDATRKHDNSVERDVQDLMLAVVPTTESLGKDRPASPWVRFEWGRSATVRFNGIVKSISVTYSLFDGDGTPLRARCALSIEEAGGDTPRQNPTSGGLEARRSHQVVAGDSLPMLAWREYGDATAWRVIAEANEVDDPMRLRPGTELLIPAQEGTD
ncbi:LysM peptidoglycan-binding domain-containing protein [Amycolatopsis minnesotensis]|uniref:LysM peptidoglycan-binding domain-containing protein n=1 Tax=Amycolatopsis minnesotensis TaxID=337894 RepID=A0ABN2QBI3_9PSEU